EVAVAAAAVAAVSLLNAPAIACFTKSGFTARVVSSQRPPVPVVTVTDSVRTWRQLALVWGVRPVLCEEEANYENMLKAARAALRESGLARPGDRIVVTFGFPFHVRGTTNTLRIEEV
ncbi:MAG: pyruvate kinase alpha/beta domain-containing protein, partial [Gemmatimonadota bacterium]